MTTCGSLLRELHGHSLAHAESDPVITAVLFWSRIAVPPAYGWTRTGFTGLGSGPAEGWGVVERWRRGCRELKAAAAC